MKKITLFFLVFLTPIVFYGQDPLRIRISLIGNDTLSFNKLVFGFDTLATNGLDTNLGEVELPPLTPPSGIGVYGVFVFYDTISGGNIWSYQDIRPFPISYSDTVRFFVRVFRDFGVKLKFYWPTIGNEFHSAWLVDDYTGNLIQANMKEQNSLIVENDFLDEFCIKVTLPVINSVSSTLNEKIKIETSDDYIKFINNRSIEFRFEIFDVLCNLLFRGIATDEIVVLPRFYFKMGLYIVRITDKMGNSVIQKFILF